MGIFSLFGKKDRQQTGSADRTSARKKSDSSTTRGTSAGRSHAAKRDAQAARATALKIDAIESEMSSEFVKPAAIPPKPKTGAPAPSEKPRGASRKTAPPDIAQPTLPAMGPTTKFLMDNSGAVNEVAAPAQAAVIEEAAIMFANNQIDVVEHLLLSAIGEDKLGSSAQDAWWMLFDLYRITGKQQEFEHLSIEYASKFETSPPAWAPLCQPEMPPQQPSGAIPMVPFSGRLDANCGKLLERVQRLAESHQALRLEFIRVSEVDAAGCALLLNTLKKLQKSGHDLVLVGAPELAEKIRAIVEVGRRDDTEDAWLLLLEILRLLNRETEFEETSIDYCVTFEVSPPAFLAPNNRVTMEASEQPRDDAAGDGFVMPAVIEGKVDQLIVGIASYSDQHDPAIIDCSRLIRVDFQAAGRLLTGLAPFCGNGKVLELRDVNHLVAALFGVIGLRDIVRVLPRKQ